MADGVPYAGVGLCTTLGAGKAAVVGGILGGVATGILAYIYTLSAGEEVISKEERVKYAFISGLLIGGLTATLAYFYCKGVEVGAPVRVMH